MANPLHRIDTPTDYHSLWIRLKERIREIGDEHAIRAATDINDSEVHRHQGAYRVMKTIETEMDVLIDKERSERREAS